ncbi:hypothetical protein ABT024_28585 [Streptomyces sp. NPDC002812]|uniref:hypothetical protein n=1 Tax=Streptomyces sp. NPDC002812 TaxID=3154434 RepID=UPI00332EA298
MIRQEPTAEAWADALKLYEWLCTFVAVSPREHDEWWLDVGAIMRLETRDPRGRESIDPYEGEEERVEDPFFPWLGIPSSPADTEGYRRRVDEIPASSVRSLLGLLGAAGHRSDLSVTPGWAEHRPERERRAEVILSRFPEGTRFYTNLAWQPDHPDFSTQPFRSHAPFGRYDWDAGLIAVNDEEVAVLWNFQNT